HRAQARGAGVLRKIGAGEHADRTADEDTDQGHDHAAVDRVQQSAAAAGGRRHGGEQLERHARQAVADERPENGPEKEQPDGGREAGEAERQDVGELADRATVHTEDSARRSRRSSMKRAAAITEKVMRNSAPSAISEELYRSPTASVNSLAMEAEMVVPGASSDEPMRCALPMTKVTAMVSPSARPRPSMMPPIMPVRAYGTTTCQITSQVVAPRP